MINCVCSKAMLGTIYVQKRAQPCLSMLSRKCVYKSYIYLIYMYIEDWVLNNL